MVCVELMEQRNEKIIPQRKWLKVDNGRVDNVEPPCMAAN